MINTDQASYASVHLSRALYLLNQVVQGGSPGTFAGYGMAAPSGPPATVEAIIAEMDMCKAWLLGEHAQAPRVVELRRV